jgi:lysophospholipase L1-like esterase
MKLSQISGLAIIATLLASACEPKLDAPKASAGNANFTKYVALGNSLTAGFADNGLYNEGMTYGYPNLIAQQMKAAGGGDFVTPFFSDARSNGTGYLTLAGFVNGVPQLVPVTTGTAAVGPSNFNNPALPFSSLPQTDPNYYKLFKLEPFTGTLNNLGVPGIRLSDIISTSYGVDDPNPSSAAALRASFADWNPLYERLLPSGQKSLSYLQFAVSTDPTFFTCWLGNNDVLQFAASGGGAGLGGQAIITPSTYFQQIYTSLVDALLADKNTGGALTTIPSVTSIPFFTTVTEASIKAVAPPGVSIYIQTGNADGTAGAPRAIQTGDLITLTADSIGVTRKLPVGPGGALVDVPKGFSPAYPLQNNDVLDVNEAAAVNAAVQSYNSIIKQLADQKGLALVDANAFLEKARTGIIEDGISLNTAFISGGIFGLDGVHLTPRGNALAANEFIKAINAKYGSSLATVDIIRYRGVKIP